MALFNERPDERLDGDPSQRRDLIGIALALVCSDPSLQIEIQRAPDSSGLPGTFIDLTRVGPYSAAGGVFIDVLPDDGASWWYKARPVGWSVDPGAYTNPVRSSPYSIRQEIIDAWMNDTAPPPMAFKRFLGDPRPILVTRQAPPLVINGEFDIWEYS